MRKNHYIDCQNGTDHNILLLPSSVVVVVAVAVVVVVVIIIIIIIIIIGLHRKNICFLGLLNI